MKNLKSILKKLTLILLASFILAGSPNLLAMDPDPKGEDVPSFHEAGAQAKESRVDFEGAEDSEDSDSDFDSDFDTESEYSDDEQEKRKIKFVLQDGTKIPLSENFNHNISGYISALVMFSGSEVEIKIDESSPENIRQVCNETIIKKFINYLEKVSENTSMLMLRSDLEDETPDDFKALAVLANFFEVNFLMHACAPRCVETLTSTDNLNKFKKDPTMRELFGDYFPGWRWLINLSQYHSYFVDSFGYKETQSLDFDKSILEIRSDCQHVRVEYDSENYSLSISRRDGDNFVVVSKEYCVCGFTVSPDGKTVCILSCADSLKILRWNGRKYVNQLLRYNRVSRYINGCRISQDSKTIYIYSMPRETRLSYTLNILSLIGDRFVEVCNYENISSYELSTNSKMVRVKLLDDTFKILRKYPEVKNIEQAMFLSLAQNKHNSETQTGLDLTLPDSEEQNTIDLLETFRSMPTETQSGLIRDWNVKVSAEIELELGVDQAEAEPGRETRETLRSRLVRIGRNIMSQVGRCNRCAVSQED
jgi:hypothetical protein